MQAAAWLEGDGQSGCGGGMDRCGTLYGIGLERAQESCRQGDESSDELENAADGDADEAEWKEKQPDEGVEDECKEGKRPAKDKEKTPEKKLDHGAQPPGAAIE